MSRKSTSKQPTSQNKTSSPAIPKRKDKPARLAREPGEDKSMLNFLLILVAILPFVFSRTLMDPALSIRFLFLAIFIFLFVLIFYVFMKRSVSMGWPLLAKLVFGLGIAYGLWNLGGFAYAVNKQQMYFGISKHFLNLALLFIVVQVAEKHEKHLFRICAMLAITSIIHTIIGIGQYTGSAFTSLPGNLPPYGLMANRNLFGSAQVLLLPFSIFVLYKGSLPWKGVASFSILGIVSSAVLSQTRSSWLAAITFIVVSLLLVIIFSPTNRKKWAVGTLAGVVLSVFLAFMLVRADTEGEFSSSIKDRTENIFKRDTTVNTSSAAGNVTERLKIWNKTAELVKDNLFTGVGVGNWKITVAKYGSEGLAYAKGKFIPDHPHNDYLLVIAESGIPGVLLYYGMWLVIVIIAFKNIIQAKTEESRILNIMMLAGLAAWATDSFFSFPGGRMEHTLYIMLMAGIIIGTYLNNTVRESAPMKKWLWPLFLLVAGFCFFLALEKSRFEQQLILSKTYEGQKNYQMALEEGLKGKSKFVNIGENGLPIECYVSLAYKGLGKTDMALKEIDEAIRIHPYNKTLYINKGTFYTDLGQYQTAINLYLQALKLTPNFDIIYLNLASNYFKLKNYKTTVDALNRVSNLAAYPQAHELKRQAEAMVQAGQ